MFCSRKAGLIGRSVLLFAVGASLGLVNTGRLVAQAPAGRSAPSATGEPPSQVAIEREPLVLKQPETYRVSLSLQPGKSVEIVARADGIVANVLIHSGEAAREQAEIIRLNSRERQLEMDRAKAAFQAAQIEQRSASEGTEKELADARLRIAKIGLDLAEYRLDQTIHRAPFDGTVQTVHVVEGQFVRAGQPLATLVETSQLVVQMPIDRNVSKAGDAIKVRVEGKSATATVQQVLPLTKPFEPLRDLFQSIATGVVVIDNGAGEWHPGQTVYSDLIPRLPVTEVPNAAISNTNAGSRRVQVIRLGFVRDVPIELLGAVGEERTIVTGPFGNKDELIVRSSEELQDGTQVMARTELAEEPPKTNPAPRRPRTPRRVIPPASR